MLFADQDAIGRAEPLKRQRRWKTDSLKMPEPQRSSVTPTATPKDAFQPTSSRRNFSRSDSSVSIDDAPKERVGELWFLWCGCILCIREQLKFKFTKFCFSYWQFHHHKGLQLIPSELRILCVLSP